MVLATPSPLIELARRLLFILIAFAGTREGSVLDSKLDRENDFGENRYIDTRGVEESPIAFSQAVVNGLATGGGLYVPEALPSLSLEEICKLAEYPYRDRASYIYKAFNIDLTDDVIASCMNKSYSDNFDNPAIAPITTLPNDFHMLELWHGPTSAFKDMALQCLPNFFEASAAKLRDEGKLDHGFCILVATSGDTGKAALEGFKGIDGVDICVLFPDGGVSDLQRKQMVTTEGDNVCVWAVKGNFDDCQTTAKKVFSDEAFNARLLADDGVVLSSANSINWGRLMPQIVYYISSYAELVAEGRINAGELIDVCVPTGNFGNILAAWYAKQMGTPIEHLLCASNENRVLTDFIETGIYDISSRDFVLTPSPSMDILVSSNVERQLFELSGRDPKAVSEWMADLNAHQRFELDPRTKARLSMEFKAASIDNATCLATIKQVLDEFNYLMDPHTAVAYAAACHLKGDNPILVASTAHWAKFGSNVYRAINEIAPDAPLPSSAEELTGCELNQDIALTTNEHDIPKGLAMLDKMPVRFNQVIDGTVPSVESKILEFLDK